MKYASRHVLYSLPKLDSGMIGVISNVAARPITCLVLDGVVNNPARFEIIVRVFVRVGVVLVVVVRPDVGVLVARDFIIGRVEFWERTETVARALPDCAAIFPRNVVAVERSAAWDIPMAVKIDKNKNRKPFFLIQ